MIPRETMQTKARAAAKDAARRIDANGGSTLDGRSLGDFVADAVLAVCVEEFKTLREKWAIYQLQHPRSFDGTMVDEVAIERENKLMDAFIQDLDALLSGGRSLAPQERHDD